MKENLLMCKSIVVSAILLTCITNASAQFSGGNGTSGNPYIITTDAQLNDVRLNLNAYFKLGNDIDLSGYTNWDPIGNTTTPFIGNFDGNGMVISNLTIDRQTAPNNVGLFGYIENATISNLGVVISTSGVIGGGGGGASYVDAGVGGLVGFAKEATISGCYVTGNAGAFVKGMGDEVGGLVGYVVGSTISECYATVDVNQDAGASFGGVGGLIGGIETGVNSITKCYATGNVTGTEYMGGLIGASGVYAAGQSLLIENCYSTGNVTSIASTYHDGLVGGFIGAAGYFNTTSTIISKCFSTGNVEIDLTGSSAGGGFMGQASGNVFVDHCYAFGNITETGNNGNVGGFVGLLFSPSTFTECYADNSVSGGGSYTGAFAGNAHSAAAFTDCYSNDDKNTSSLPLIGNYTSATTVEGLSDADMPGADIFVTWDPSSWDIIGGEPFLRFQGLAPSITSEATYFCVEGESGSFALTATGVTPITWTITGAPAGVTLSGSTLNISSSVKKGTYTFTIKAINGSLNSATQSFTLKVNAASPYITGPAYMTIIKDYASTSSDEFEIYGTSPVTITKISGDAKITWNNTTKKLDIAAGLPVGVYEVKLRATNEATSYYTFIFTLTVAEQVFYIDIPENFPGGKVTAEPRYITTAGQTVTLTITPDQGNTLTSIHVYRSDNGQSIPLSGTGLTRTFEMPPCHITVVAVFGSTGIDEIAPEGLVAFSQNGSLYLSGLTPGASWSVYNVTGSLVSQGIATDSKAVVSLPGRGLYIVRSANKVVKVLN